MSPYQAWEVLVELEFYPQRNEKILTHFKQRMNTIGFRFTKKKRLAHITPDTGPSWHSVLVVLPDRGTPLPGNSPSEAPLGSAPQPSPTPSP